MTVGVLIAVALVGMAGVLVALLRRRYAIVVVEGESMLPTLRAGDRLLLRRVPPNRIRTGQIVVIGSRAKYAGLAPLTIKRVVARAGEPVPATMDDAHPGAVVPPGYVAALGDNPAASLDSRQCGYVAQNRIQGVIRSPGRQRMRGGDKHDRTH